MIRPLLLTTLLLAAGTAFADCDSGLVAVALGSLHLPLQYDANQHLQNAVVRCQALPADPGKSVVALAMRHPAHDAQGSPVDVISLDLVLLRGIDNQVLMHYLQPDLFNTRPVELTDLQLDMAPYTLNNQLRAFGVRTGYNTFGIAAANVEVLNLYAGLNGTITPVLTGLAVGRRFYDGGYGPRCTSFAPIIDAETGESHFSDHLYAGTLTSTVRTVDMGTAFSEGFADLFINETRNVTNTRNVDGTCTPTAQPPVTALYVLHYDGHAYAVPPELQGD